MDGADPRKRKPASLAVAGASVCLMNGLGASHNLLMLRTSEHLQPGAMLGVLLPEKKGFRSVWLEAEHRGHADSRGGGRCHSALMGDGRQHGIGPEVRFILPGVSSLWLKTSPLRMHPQLLDRRRTPFPDFPGGPVVRTLSFHCRGYRFDPWSSS